MSKYDYLKKYIIPRWTSQPGNSFYNISYEEILEAERKINLKFPDQLKEFWIEIGCGFFEASCKELGIQQSYYPNRLLSPVDIVSILTEGEESGLITEQGLVFLKEGEIPIFEIADFTSYLVMRQNSEYPNAVYRTSGKMIEDSFEKFIWKLYHVSPTYYLGNY